MKPEKKIIALFFLVLIIIPMSVGMFWLCQQYYSHYIVKKQLKDTHVQIIVLAPERLQWLEQHEKLLIEDQVFHVQQYELLEDGFYLVKGIFNTDEDKIYAILSQLLHQQNDKEEDGCMSKLVSFCWGESIESFLNNTNCFNNNRTLYNNHYSFTTPAYFKNVLIPPPKV